MADAEDVATRIRCMEFALQMQPNYNSGGMNMSPTRTEYHNENQAVLRAEVYYAWVTNQEVA